LVSICSILFIAASYWIFYSYPRIATEADGPATVLYSCMISERYDTVTSLTGEKTDYHSATAKLCVIKNMPMAASNVLFIDNDAETSGFALVLISDSLLLGVFMLSRKFL
jgi:hypothetical protein